MHSLGTIYKLHFGAIRYFHTCQVIAHVLDGDGAFWRGPQKVIVSRSVGQSGPSGAEKKSKVVSWPETGALEIVRDNFNFGPHFDQRRISQGALTDQKKLK